MLIILLSLFSHAQAGDQITSLCEKQAIELIGDLESDVFTEMNVSEKARAIDIAEEHCLKMYTSGNMEAIVTSKSASEKPGDEESDDWFTEHIIRGEKPKKAGNKRLERMRTH